MRVAMTRSANKASSNNTGNDNITGKIKCGVKSAGFLSFWSVRIVLRN